MCVGKCFSRVISYRKKRNVLCLMGVKKTSFLIRSFTQWYLNSMLI